MIKRFYFPLATNDSFAGYSRLCWHLRYGFLELEEVQVLPAIKASIEKLGVILMILYVI